MALLSRHHPHPPIGFSSPWFESAVFGFDRWLRRRQGVFEYTGHPGCIFRVQHGRADERVALSDGTRIAPGDPILDLHFWNEQLPPMGADGATLRWACRMRRAIEISLTELARYLDDHPDLDDIAVVRIDMRLGTAARSRQIVRLSARLGFEPAADLVMTGSHVSGGTLHRFGENLYIFLLVLATNPVAVGTPVLRRDHKLVYLSRAALARR